MLYEVITGLDPGVPLRGYEIHLGETTRGPLARPLLRLIRRSGYTVDLEDGAVSTDGRVWGTYLHGFFETPEVRNALLGRLRSRRGLEPRTMEVLPTLDAELDRLADHRNNFV